MVTITAFRIEGHVLNIVISSGPVGGIRGGSADRQPNLHRGVTFWGDPPLDGSLLPFDNSFGHKQLQPKKLTPILKMGSLLLDDDLHPFWIGCCPDAYRDPGMPGLGLGAAKAGEEVDQRIDQLHPIHLECWPFIIQIVPQVDPCTL
jgi:hypothetical protein